MQHFGQAARQIFEFTFRDSCWRRRFQWLWKRDLRLQKTDSSEMTATVTGQIGLQGCVKVYKTIYQILTFHMDMQTLTILYPR